jgi:hypothetical protein
VAEKPQTNKIKALMPTTTKAQISRTVHLTGLFLVICGLPFSVIAVSIGQFALVINSLLEGGLKEKWLRLKNCTPAWVLMSLYLLHVLGLLYSDDFAYALKDLRIKLPLLILPLILGSSKPITKSEFKLLMKLFIAAVFTASLFSLMAYTGLGSKSVSDTREISLFISHIRFSLMVCLCFVLLLHHSVHTKAAWHQKIIGAGLILWFIVYLILLESLTGLMIGVALMLYTAFSLLHHNTKKWTYSFIGIFAVLIISSSIYVVIQIHTFYQIEVFQLEKAEHFTKNGELYMHQTERQQVENGHFVYVNIAKGELEETWALRSQIPLQGADHKGQLLYSTLLRYLSSKGLKKDADGVNALDASDVKAIEQGITNVNQKNGRNLNTRIYETIWEIHNYLYDSHNPAGNSLAQRFVYWKTGWWFYKNQPLFGVGTGDIKQAYAQAHGTLNPHFPKEYRNRAHNQYLTFLYTFGVFGALWYLLILIYPFFLPHLKGDFIFWGFYIIYLMSMLNEDTLESQIGVSFIAVFWHLLLYGMQGNTFTSKSASSE